MTKSKRTRASSSPKWDVSFSPSFMPGDRSNVGYFFFRTKWPQPLPHSSIPSPQTHRLNIYHGVTWGRLKFIRFSIAPRHLIRGGSAINAVNIYRRIGSESLAVVPKGSSLPQARQTPEHRHRVKMPQDTLERLPQTKMATPRRSAAFPSWELL